MSGTLPVLKISPLNTVMALLCLVMSVVVLVEPILPLKLSDRTRAIRRCILGRFIYRLSIIAAFILGLAAGFDALTKNLPTFSWLMDSVVYVGFVILLVMLIKLVLIPMSEREEAPNPADDR